MNITTFAKTAIQWAKANPQIWIASIGVASSVMTAVTSAKAHAEAVAHELEYDEPSKNLVEYTKRHWKTYIPAAVSLGVTVASIISLHSVGMAKYKALSAAYGLAQVDLSELRKAAQKANLIAPPKKEKDRESAREDASSEGQTVVFMDEEIVFQDALSGRLFRSTPEKVRKACNEISQDTLNYGPVSLNDFYSYIDLDQVSFGDELGWTHGVVIEPVFTPKNLDGKPVLSVSFNPAPQTDWFRL
nr:MAG TPA: hypothetical protein [Caudoviricetes sp.]